MQRLISFVEENKCFIPISIRGKMSQNVPFTLLKNHERDGIDVTLDCFSERDGSVPHEQRLVKSGNR